MRYNLCRGALWVLFAASIPAIVLTPALAGKKSRCCCRCNQPQCVCPVPVLPPGVVQPAAAYQPVYQTQLVQQPVLQQRDVVATEYRYEPVTETVPTTIIENVTVDEGSYQTVWVPRVTTRPVARTVYQSRTAFRSVPYQVTHRVTEYAWQTQPYQTVRYAPVGLPAYAAAPSGSYTGIAYGAPWSTTVNQISALPAYDPGRVVAWAPVASPPVVSSLPPYPASPALASSTLSAAAPILPRSPTLADSSATARNESLFVPAPSAAQVWRTPRGTLLR